MKLLSEVAVKNIVIYDVIISDIIAVPEHTSDCLQETRCEYIQNII